MADGSESIDVILDVDTGVDDALALLLACRCPLINVLAVTCVHGNAEMDKVLRNTLQTLDAAGAPMSLPVATGFDAPLVDIARKCLEIHGQDGLGDLSPPLPPTPRTARPEHAVELLNATLRSSAAKVTVVALAPLTNVAVAYRLAPALWHEKVERIVWMGGAIASGGNATAWSEANARYDPEAAHMVLESGLPMLIYPWDVFVHVGFTPDELLALGITDVDVMEAPPERPTWSLLAGRLMWRELHYFGMGAACLGDAGALATAVLGAAKVRKLHVTVELQGSRTRGMTVCDLREFAHPPDDPQEPANAEVVMEVDGEALKAFFAKHVYGAD